jgi:hydroxyacylglutathione hydrolase
MLATRVKGGKEKVLFPKMKLHVLPAGPIQTNAYLLSEPALRQAVLIDAPGAIAEIVRPILKGEGCSLTALWLTHGHWDHTQGAAEIAREFKVPVSGHPADQTMFERPETMAAFMEGIELEPVKVDHWLARGERLQALGHEVEVRHVPGHCPGNVLFHWPRLRAAFVGDAIFQGSVGRTDFPNASFEQLERSIRSQIYTLPDETNLFPGHGPKTSVGAEKASNPHVR